MFSLQMKCIQSFIVPVHRFGTVQTLHTLQKFSGSSSSSSSSSISSSTSKNLFLKIHQNNYKRYSTESSMLAKGRDVLRNKIASTVPMASSITTTTTASAAASAASAATNDNQQTEMSSSSPSTEEATTPVKRVPRKFQPFPFEYHQILTLEVESLTNRGIGICRTDITTSTKNNDTDEEQEETTTSSWVVMVPNVIPGETIQCQIYRNHKSYSEADLLTIITPSPNRISPICSLFDKCGGCQYQHMNIQTQRQWKKNHVIELLERVGKLKGDEFRHLIHDTVGTEEVYRYRSKITPHYDRPITFKPKDEDTTTTITSSDNNKQMEIRAIGFKQKSNRNILDVSHCYIATDAINEKLKNVREDKFKEAREGRLRRPKKGATLLLRDAHIYDDIVEENGRRVVVDNDVPVVETDPNVYVKTSVKGVTFRFLAGNFFQNNPYMLPVMVDHVVDAAVKPNSKGEKMTHLIDCYCGSGLFCLTSAEHFDVCVGIEVNEKAVEEATINADLNDIENCKFVSASAEAIFMSVDPVEIKSNDKEDGTLSILVRDFPKATTTVVIDPPRKGCSTEFLDQLYQFAPQRIVYMSCDPATQARDAEGIVGAGYEITSVQPFDLFPQTRHIECLAIFERKE